ncbi:MAG: hypothetical protein EAX95_02230 [Candidatus Thorarchaeota archaeon]|nr:hypothetical protein [Candidatus Thorarchaeota archaeon]
MVVAALDAGTTGVRCMIVDRNGTVLALARRSWSYRTPSHLEIAKEFDPEEFWDLACEVIREATLATKEKVTAIATTSQRHGVVFLDKNGKELYAGPNIDARGAMTQYIVEESLGARYLEITGCWPPLMFTPARLAWFEEDEPEIHATVAHILPINDWLTYRLSGEYVTDPSSASATGLLDIRTRSWSEEIFSTLGLDQSLLPDIREAGSVVGTVSPISGKDCALPDGIPVVQGGTDTHCALLASQAQVGEVIVIAGSTTPVMSVMDEVVCSAEQTIWTGCHILPGAWTIESNATLTGAYLEWVVKLLCERADNPRNCMESTFASLDAITEGMPPGSNDVYAALGPSIMDTLRITDIPLAQIRFPQPALPNVIPLSSSSLIHAVLENIAYAVRGNCEQIEEITEVSRVKTIGGVSRSTAWSRLLANVLGRPVMVPSQSEGSLLGAAICAAKGNEWFSSLSEASEHMVKWKQTVEPDSRTKEYESCYSRWKEMAFKGDK